MRLIFDRDRIFIMLTLTFVINIIYRSESTCVLFFVNVTIIAFLYHENVMMRKGAEMGHFELIGSTIVLLFKKGHIDLLPEIKECIKGDKEVRVIQGQHIANRTVF